ncbi:sugar ABC transporter permease [Fusibacter sp. 3D3]|uniref:ABC transporter permease n=1 Tax=Fusibacter sp. 3D3 TaxID=1048380 RepID=UPI000852B3CF|nr:ABC transporter permease subunit [Fusibacter sp. 3D3]GAU77303.1 multiple sugar ABC transporter membrane-spanning permease protein MsmF [Fusibacter sp. 3D3]
MEKVKKTKKRKNKLYYKNNAALYVMMLPGVIALLANNYLPMGGILLAFKDYNYTKGFWGSKWVGMENFKYLFNSDQAMIITRNTLLYNLVFITVSVTIALGLAIALGEIRNQKIAKIYQSIFFLPYFLSWVVVSYLVFSLLSVDMGMINNVLKSFGMAPINWYTEPKFWPWILVTVNTWKWTGYDSIIYLAAIIGIDKTYYEAAAVDGATRWQQIKHITIPSIMPVITILTLLKVGRIFYGDFGLFWNIPKNMGILYNVTNVIDTYVYRALTQSGDIGMAAASGLYQAVVGLVLILTANKIVKMIDPEQALM